MRPRAELTAATDADAAAQSKDYVDLAAVAFGVGGSGQHGPDEYADLSTVVPYYHALREFLSSPQLRP